MAFFILLDGPRWIDALFRRLPAEHEERARGVADEMARVVGGYVVGSVAIAAAAGLFSFAMMKLLGLPFAVPLAVLMALTALIPLIGSAIGATPIALVAGLDSFPGALIVWVLAFVIYQQIESHVLGPYVYKRTLKLHPLLAIVGVLAGASLLGILGALLAIPIAAMIQILIREYSRRRRRVPSPSPRSGRSLTRSRALVRLRARMETRSLQNRLLMATTLWREATNDPLPRLAPGEPAEQIGELELLVVDLLCREATAATAREIADKTWDLVYDRAEDDPVRKRVVECHDHLAKLSAGE